MPCLEPTESEARFMASLRRCLAKKPDSVWLFAADSGLYVMRKDKSGERATSGYCYDQNYILGDLLGREIDGGDW
jgi:hypothetical protein